MQTERKRALPVCFAAFLLINGKIWTGNPSKPEAQAMAISGERIVAVGNDEEILKLSTPGLATLDVGGKRVLPGFNDAHVHFFDGGAALAGPQLRAAKSAEEFRNTLAEYAKHQPRGHWITNGQWDNQNWSDTRLPTHALIDEATRHWPVFVSRMDGHLGLANSVALAKAHIDRDTKDVPGGIIERDTSGNPTGILKDAAQNLISAVIPAPTPDDIRTALRAAQSYANAQGVTSIQDMSLSPAVFRGYQELLREGDLHVRVSGHQPLRQWERLAAVGVAVPFGNEWLHIGGLKGFADGSVGAGTAWFLKPYTDDPKNSGIASDELSNSKQMYSDMKHADDAGLQLAVHAIGDKANHQILDLYERLLNENGYRDRRLRIEHAQHLAPNDLRRLADLHVIASMQPYQCIDDGRWAEKRIGAERAKTAFAFRSLEIAGTTLAFGSDWPVVPMSPLMGIYAAVTRRTLDGKHPDGWTPSEKITVEQAVRAYTVGSAFASFDEGQKGTLQAGKLADFVVLSDDIFVIDPAKIPDVKVEATVVGGRFVTGVLPRKKDPSGLLIR